MKKDKAENKHSASGIGGGFLLGFLLGVLITLLLTTKKGREILRDIMDRIIQKIASIDDSLDAIKTTPSSEEENDFVKPSAEDVKEEVHYLTIKHPKEKVAEKPVNEKGGKQEKLGKRLFFRKATKKN